jgi:hypothetical protein
VPLRESLSGIEVWPEDDRWRWEVVRFSDRGTRTVARGTAASEAAARRAARWRAARGWLWVAAAAVVATTIAVMVWLTS